MRRCLFVLLLCGLSAAARAQEPEPDASTEKAALALNPPGHVGFIRGAFFTPDGKQLVTVGKDRTVQFWDVVSGERLRVLRLPFEPTASVLAPDGHTLAVGRGPVKGQRRVFLVNLHDGRVLGLAGGENHGGSFTVLAFSRDGAQLAGSLQGWGSPVHLLWDGLEGVWEKKPEEIARIKGRSFTPDGIREMFDVICLAFSPDGKRIAMGRLTSGAEGQKTAYIADVPAPGARPEKPLGLNLHSNVQAVAWTPDGQEVVTTDRSYRGAAVVFWAAANGGRVRQLNLRSLGMDGYSSGQGLHFLDGGRLLFTWSHDGSDRKTGPRGTGQSILSVADLKEERGKAFLPTGRTNDIVSLGAAAADGKVAALVGGNEQNEILLWDVTTGTPLHHLGGEMRTPRSAGWSKDGIGLDAFEENKKPFFRFALGFKDVKEGDKAVEALQSRQNVDGSDYSRALNKNEDGTVQLEKLPDGKVELKLPNRKVTLADGVTVHATLSPGRDARWFAWSGYPGSTLHLGNLATGKEVFFLRPFRQGVFDLVPSPDGRWLLSVNASQVAYLYRIAGDPARTEREPQLYLFVLQGEWILWTKEGYYAASPGGEKLMGWTVDNGPDRLPTFYPAERFRKRLYRPDVIKLVLEKGSVADALKAARAEATDVERLLPPRAALAVDRSALPKVTVQATAEAAAPGQPVTALRLLVDGRPLPDGQATLDLKEPREKAAATWTVMLPPGDHELKVLARSADAAGASEAVVVPQAPAKAGPTLHLLAIGINGYRDKDLRLNCAVNDARALAQAFQSCAGDGKLFSRFRGDKPLLDAGAKRDDVLKALTALRKAAKSGDLAVVYFAGHGVKDGKDFYLLTQEADTTKLADTAVSGTRLRKELGEIPCQVLLILDACHAAAGVRAFKPATDDAARGLTDDDCAVAVFCAAMGQEYAQEEKDHGLFTQALVEALSRKDRVPYNYGDGRQYVHHLHAYVFDTVQRASKDQQHPFLNLPWVTQSFPVRRLAEPAPAGEP
jgi:WD40 repeat protein